MARDGAGTYNLPQPPFTPGTVISSTATNSNNSDIAAALTQSIARDGQTVPTANLPMGTYRHTGVGNAVARSDYAAMGQVQDGAGIWCGTAGGTANALTLTPSPAIAAYAAGQVFRFTAGAAANTGATTVAVSGLTAQAVQNAGAALTGGEIAAGRQYQILYDGTNFQLAPFASSTPGAGSVTTAMLQDNAVTNAKLADMAANTVKVRAAGTSGDPADLALSASQLVGRGSTGDVAALGVGGGVQISGTTLQLAAGTIVDRAYAEFTTVSSLNVAIPRDDTIPQNTEGTQILSASITPKSTTNRVRVTFSTQCAANTASGDSIICALFLNSGASAIMARHVLAPNNGNVWNLSFQFEHVPGATSAQTYAVRLGASTTAAINVNGDWAGNRLFGGVSRSTLILEEITV